MSIGLLELAADTLGELLAEVVFVGGGAVTRLRQRHGAETDPRRGPPSAS